jgi:hypothetical protein
MVDGLLCSRNRTKKPLAIVLSRAGRGSRGRDSRGEMTKTIWNCHNEFPLYNKHILIKNGKK